MQVIIFNTVGIHTVYFVASADRFGVRTFGTTTGSIDNVSVKEVGQNWMPDEWIIDNDNGNQVMKFIGNAANQYLRQSDVYTPNDKIRLQFTLSNFTSGQFRAISTGVVWSTPTINATNGTFTYDIDTTGTSNGHIYFQAVGGSFNGYLDDVSVIKITDDTDLPRINYTNFDYEDVLGDELVNYDNLTYGSGGWSLVGSKWVFDDTTNGYLTIDNISVEVGQKYQVTVNVSISSGDANFRITSGNSQTLLFNYTDFSDGITTFETTVTGVDGFLQRLFAVTSLTDNPFTLNSISIKRITEDVVIPYSGTGSILLEPQSTNLITYSEQFDDSYWTKARSSIISNQITAPNGTDSADKFFDSTDNNTHLVYRSLSVSTSDEYTFSCFLKKGSLNKGFLAFDSSVNASVVFDLENGTIESEGSSITSSNIEQYSNNWYKCSFTHTPTATPRLYRIGTYNGGISYAGTGTDFIYIWGAQFEEQSYATSYIPTSGSTVTRNADVCNNAGSSDLINSTEGVLYAEISALADDGTNRILGMSNGGDFNNSVLLRFSSASNRIQAQVRLGGVYQCTLNYDVTDATEFNKIAFKYKQNDFSLFVNGVERATDTSGNVITGLNVLDFDVSNTNEFYGNVKCVAVFKEALTDTELTCLTT